MKWTVLLHSETHRKPITSITAVLLQFVTYLLTPSLYNVYVDGRWQKYAEVTYWWECSHIHCALNHLLSHRIFLGASLAILSE
jgi:hypothetical protein